MSDTIAGSGGTPLVVNRRAGRASEVLDIDAALARGGAGTGSAFRVIEVEPAALGAALDRLLTERPETIAVAGGDGTLRTAAEALAGTDTTLVPVPAGTLNHFARRCGVETVQEALAAPATGRTVRDAVGVADDRVFLNTLITGAYPELVERRVRYDRFLPRPLAAALAFLVTAVRTRPVRVTLETDEGRSEHRTLMVWIGLGRGSFPFSHLSEPAGRRETLEVAVLRGTRPLQVVRVLARLLKNALGRGELTNVRGLAVEQVRRLVIRSPHALRAALDGEPMHFRSPLFVDVLTDALRVRVRETGPDARSE